MSILIIILTIYMVSTAISIKNYPLAIFMGGLGISSLIMYKKIYNKTKHHEN